MTTFEEYNKLSVSGYVPRHASLVTDRYRSIKIPKIKQVRYRQIITGYRQLYEPCAPLKTIQAGLVEKLRKTDVEKRMFEAHAYRKFRNNKTCVSPHIGKKYLIEIDLKDFFKTCRPAELRKSIERLSLITRLKAAGLTVDAIINFGFVYEPEDIHTLFLPQGAPSSPLLSNLVFYNTDNNIRNIMRGTSIVTQDTLAYTRYCDNLLISFNRSESFRVLSNVYRVIAGAGFKINDAKTKIKSYSNRQSAIGIVCNTKINPSNERYKNLRAEIFQAAFKKSSEQEWLKINGKIAYIKFLNPVKGKLLEQHKQKWLLKQLNTR